MTQKRRKPVKSIDKLSDDLKGQRALKGEKSVLVVTIYSLDRWIEIGRDGLASENVRREVAELQKRLKKV